MGVVVICITHVELMMIEKTKFSIFSPEFVIAILFPGSYPPWKEDTQLQSLRCMAKDLRGFFKNRQVRGCILHTENQLLHDNEMSDCKHLTLWACSLLDASIHSAVSKKDDLFAIVSLPILRNVAFRGDEDRIINLLTSLRRELDLEFAKLAINNSTLKSEIVRIVQDFETQQLPRSARCSVARALSESPVLFGGMVFTCSFCLLTVRLFWMEHRLQIFRKAGILPKVIR